MNIAMLSTLLCMVSKRRKYGWFPRAPLFTDVGIIDTFYYYFMLQCYCSVAPLWETTHL